MQRVRQEHSEANAVVTQVTTEHTACRPQKRMQRVRQEQWNQCW
jgi:hypothetical protein